MFIVKVPNAYGAIVYHCRNVFLDPNNMLILKDATDGAGKELGNLLIYGPLNVVVQEVKA